MREFGGWLALSAALAIGGLGFAGIVTPSEPAGAEALAAWAQRVSGGDPAHPAWIDAAEAANRLRPWQAGWAEGRRRVRAFDRARDR